MGTVHFISYLLIYAVVKVVADLVHKKAASSAAIKFASWTFYKTI